MAIAMARVHRQWRIYRRSIQAHITRTTSNLFQQRRNRIKWISQTVELNDADRASPPLFQCTLSSKYSLEKCVLNTIENFYISVVSAVVFFPSNLRAKPLLILSHQSEQMKSNLVISDNYFLMFFRVKKKLTLKCSIDIIPVLIHPNFHQAIIVARFNFISVTVE